MHAIIILGVSFNLVNETDLDSLSTMEITLVHNRAEEEPEDADYLAQANQLGGGNVEEKVRDSSPFSNTTPSQEQGIAPASVRDLAPPPIPVKQAQEELMTVDKSRLKEASQPQHDPLPIPPENVTAAQLFERSQEIARLSAKIEEIRKSYAVTPRQTYVRGANAREFRFASYMDAWRTKVERIGNLNYPEEAVRRGISGALLMDVAINPDGSLYSVRVLRSSGHKVLDDAATRIVKLAAPYPPLSEDILQDTDILHIPRVWQFESGGGLKTRAQ
jgi:protein TonB